LKLSKRIDGNNESLKPNGVFVILETSVPDKTPYKQGYNFYSKTYFLLLGVFQRRCSLRLLSESAAAFPYGEAKQYFEKVGFIDVMRYLKLLGSHYLFSI
jgi:demethylmenaquinone methyltransferase/2-methoxy-6-polyprenyl-1,4-benzoquinol methylase